MRRLEEDKKGQREKKKLTMHKKQKLKQVVILKEEQHSMLTNNSHDHEQWDFITIIYTLERQNNQIWSHTRVRNISQQQQKLTQENLNYTSLEAEIQYDILTKIA